MSSHVYDRPKNNRERPEGEDDIQGVSFHEQPPGCHSGDESRGGAKLRIFYPRGEKQSFGLYRASFTPYRQETFLRAFREPIFSRALQDVEEEARDFAEDMGAMLDEVDFANLSDRNRTAGSGARASSSRKNSRRPRRWNSPQLLQRCLLPLYSPTGCEKSAPETTAAPEKPLPARTNARLNPRRRSVQPVTRAKQAEAGTETSPGGSHG